MPTLDILLQPKQAKLLDALEAQGPDVPIRLGWGGARGAAKSGGLRRIAMILAATYPGIVVVIIRKHLGDLIENHVEKMRLEYPEFHSRFYRISDYEWRLDNKSRIILAYGDTPKDVQEFSRGPEFTILLVDQAEQFTEQELVWLTIPNRWPGARQRFAKSAFFFNPGGPGTEYLRRVFHKRDFKGDEEPGDWSFIQAYGWDNYEWFRGEVPVGFDEFNKIPGEPPSLTDALDVKCRAVWPTCACKTRFEIFINHTSEGRKMRGYPPAIRLGELLGSFSEFAGQYYAGVWDETTCVVPVSLAEQIIQPWWSRWISQDWAFAHNNCNIWFASGKLSPVQAERIGVLTEWPIDIVIAYREFVVSGMGEEDLARQIIKLTPETERKMLQGYYVGHDAWHKRGTADTVADQMGSIFSRHGFPAMQQADIDRVGGARLLYNCFQRNQWRKGDAVLHDAAKSGPMLLISTACVEIISAIPVLIRNPDELEDVLKVDGSIADDVYDSLRYGAKSRIDPKTKAPRAVRAREVYESHENPTSRAIAMKKFSLNERKVLTRRARWR